MGRPREAPAVIEGDLTPEEAERRRVRAYRRICEHLLDVSYERGVRNRDEKRRIIESIRGRPGERPPKPSLAEMERAADELDALGPAAPGLTPEQIRAGAAAQGG